MALKLKSALTINDYSPIISDFSNVHGFVNTDEVKEAYAGEKYILGEDKTAYAQYDLQGIADAVYNLGYRFAIGNKEPEYRKNQLYYLDENDNTLKPHESNEPLNTLWLVDPDAYGENIVRLDEKETIKSLTNINGFWYLFSKDSETSDLGEGILLIKESTFYYRPKGNESKIFLTSTAITGSIDSDKEVAIHLSLSGKRNDYTATGYKIEKSGLANDKLPLNLVEESNGDYKLKVYNEKGEELECLNPSYIRLPSGNEIENDTIAKLTVYFDDGGISQSFYLYFRNGAVSNGEIKCSKSQNGDWILSDGSRKVKVKDKEGKDVLSSSITEEKEIDIRNIEALEEESYRIEIDDSTNIENDSNFKIMAINIESVYIDVTDNILDSKKNKAIIASSERVYLKRNFKVGDGIASRSNFGITIDSVNKIDNGSDNDSWPSGTISFSYNGNLYYIKPSFS